MHKWGRWLGWWQIVVVFVLVFCLFDLVLTFWGRGGKVVI